MRSVQPVGQPGGRALQRRHHPRHRRLDADQQLDLLGGGQPGHGRQRLAQVHLRSAQQVGQPGPRAQDLGQGLPEHLEGQGPRRRRLRGGVGEVEQAVDLLAPAVAARQGGGDACAQQVDPVGLLGQAFGGLGEAVAVDVGQLALAGVAQHPLDGRLDQPLEGADHLVDADAALLGLGDGDLLDGVLQLHARGVEPLDEVGPVQQLERRGLLAGQPGIQQAADALAGVDAVEVRRGHAQGLLVVARLLGLDLVDRAQGEDDQAAELARFLVQRLLGHPHADGAALGQHVLGLLDGVGAVLGRDLQRPAGVGLAPREHLVMHLGLVHGGRA